MAVGKNFGWSSGRRGGVRRGGAGVSGAADGQAQQQAAPPQSADAVTFTKDIAPILQRSCQNCHRPGPGGPDVAPHLRGGAAVGALDEGAHRRFATRPA